MLCQKMCYTEAALKQTDLDLQMQEMGVERQRRRVSEAQRKGRESWTSYGQRLISAAVQPVGDAIRAEWERTTPGRLATAYQLIKGRIDPYVASFIGVQTILDSVSQHQRASATFIAVGRQIEWEIIASSWSKQQPYLVRKLYQQFWDRTTAKKTLTRIGNRQDMIEEGVETATGLRWERIWDDPQALRVGHAITELLRATTGLIDTVTMRTKAFRTETYIIPTAETEQYIARVQARTELLEPVYMPMVVPPYDWKDPYTGGYNLPGVGQPLIKTDRANIAEQMTREQMPEVYEGINYLQGVPWRINRRVLAVYQWAWDNSIAIGGLPLTSDLEIPPLPPKPIDGEWSAEQQKAVMREWYLVAGPLKKKNIEAKSQRIHYARLKHLAEKFHNQNIFFPMSCDFRGRLYTQPTFLSYQGCDAARGLLEFAFGKKIDTESARKWLKIQGANSYGVKGTFAERCQWVDSHAKEILAAAKDPLGTSWWRKADEPWQFLAFCVDVEAASKDPSHVSHLPCWQDGTNNGLQVLSLAFRDGVGGRATNCVSDGRPRDIYTDVADQVIRLLEQEQDPDRKVWAEQWIKFGIDRSTTKRTVMIVPYSGTIYSAVKYVRQWYLEAISPDRPPMWPDPTKPVGYLTRLIWDAIGLVVVKAQEAMDWFRTVGDECIRAGVDPTWTSPTGFIVAQDYPDYTACTVKTTILRRTQMWQIRKATEKRNKRKHCNAISPNIVHCWDAAGLIHTALRMKRARIESIGSVHDAVAVLAADGDVLARELRVAWADMFADDLVSGFRREIEARIGKKLPDPPSFGDMQSSVLLTSDYFFA